MSRIVLRLSSFSRCLLRALLDFVRDLFDFVPFFFFVPLFFDSAICVSCPLKADFENRRDGWDLNPALPGVEGMAGA